MRVSASEPPVAVITAPTDTVFQNRTPKFEFTGGHTYQCRLGDAQFAPCVSGVTYGPLDDGNYRFEVRAIAEDGLPQEGATPLFFTVDNAAPVPPTIDEPMDGAVIARRSVMLRGQTEDFTDVEVYEGTTLLGRAEIENEGTGDWKFPVDGLAPGDHQFRARTIDDAENISDYSTPVRVHVATVSITSPKPAVVSGSVQEIAFAASKPDELMFECRHEIQGGGEPEIITGCTSPFERRELIEGTHTFSVVAVATPTARVTNRSATAGPSPWTRRVRRPRSTRAPPGRPRKRARSSRSAPVDPEATFHCRYVPPDGQVQEDGCESPFMLSELADGTHRLEVIALDALGNRDATPAVRTWTVDTRAPQPAVDAAAAGAAATLSFAAEPGVTYSCALEGPGQNGAFRPCSSPHTYSGLQPGDYRFTLRAVDAAGNRRIRQRTFTIAQVLPAPTPAAHAPGDAGSAPRVRRDGRGAAGQRHDPRAAAWVDGVRRARQGRRHPVRVGDRHEARPHPAHGDTDRGQARAARRVLRRHLRRPPARHRHRPHAERGARALPARPLVGAGLADAQALQAQAVGRRQRPASAPPGATARRPCAGRSGSSRTRCAGTLTRVRQGVVAVRDKVRKRTILVRQGRALPRERPRR